MPSSQGRKSTGARPNSPAQSRVRALKDPPRTPPRPRKTAASEQIEALSARLEALAHRVDDLSSLMRAQNDFLVRMKNSNSAPPVQAPPARPPAARPAGPGPGGDYAAMVVRVRALIKSVCPPGAVVAVVSKGDSELVSLEGRQGWHFPRDHRGIYLGHHPAHGDEAIASLEQMRTMGAAYLVVPATSFWWLEHYPEFAQHLTAAYRTALYREDSCRIFDLSERRQ